MLLSLSRIRPWKNRIVLGNSNRSLIAAQSSSVIRWVRWQLYPSWSWTKPYSSGFSIAMWPRASTRNFAIGNRWSYQGGGRRPPGMTSRSCSAISCSHGCRPCPAVGSAPLLRFPYLDRDQTLVALDLVEAHEVDAIVVIPNQAVEELDVPRQLEPLVDGGPVLIGDPARELALEATAGLTEAIPLRPLKRHVPALFDKEL